MVSCMNPWFGDRMDRPRAAVESNAGVSTATALRSMHDRAAESCLAAVDVGAVALGVDERVGRVLCIGACDELAIPAEQSRVRRHPDIGRQAPQHAKGPLEVSLISSIPCALQYHEAAGADGLQHAVTVAN